MTMDFFFPDDLTPRATPEETRITDLRAEPYPDRGRVRVNMEITPFQTRPHVDVTLTDSDGIEVATTSFVEPMIWKLEFTLHVRGKADPAGGYRLEARLYYPEGPTAEPVQFEFEIPPAE
jgi:hypothetical protein